MLREGVENFKVVSSMCCIYFEGKPEGVKSLTIKIRNLFVTLSAPKREMASYDRVCNKVTRPISNQFDFL
jgi:hypothetical protein